MKSRPWNVDIESLSNLKLKFSLVKSPTIDAAYQLYLHLCDNNDQVWCLLFGILKLSLTWDPSFGWSYPSPAVFVLFTTPMSLSWRVDAGMKAKVTIYRYGEQHLCDVLPMEVKKLNLKDQCGIPRNLRRNKSMKTEGQWWWPLEGSQHCRSHSETWWRAWQPLQLSSLTPLCPSPWSPDGCTKVSLEWRSNVSLTSCGITSLLPMLNENCSPRSREESNLDLKMESDYWAQVDL